MKYVVGKLIGARVKSSLAWFLERLGPFIGEKQAAAYVRREPNHLYERGLYKYV